jgi:hypothetical protein
MSWFWCCASLKGGTDMNNWRTLELAIRRNNDGSYSVIDTRVGIRLVKAGFQSHNEAKEWCDNRHIRQGNKDHNDPTTLK